MIPLRTLIITISIIFTTSLLSLPASALSPAEAAQEARARTGGKVLSVKPKDSKSYRVKVLLPNGQVRNITINGANHKSNKPK